MSALEKKCTKTAVEHRFLKLKKLADVGKQSEIRENEQQNEEIEKEIKEVEKKIEAKKRAGGVVERYGSVGG